MTYAKMIDEDDDDCMDIGERAITWRGSLATSLTRINGK